ncbi:hypothetical protein SODALDRAFT_332630 [Sodiomyces alkalinus F11]|uniref:LPXTG-domain-containing protein n=1 Tax=Sodiomyces alkalinus (strain CBS 110278 / VKM F-3762 / F11) TaxID=1314773 RepID=A0A3N2PXI7_SODAK|nr:hypothetical protein SODALDRAFT_332630 [Sodiomyces alkalinus F11]ROT39207.1 hypothetical protein SODALDRAFT_332630 [Sodiomyces alkalinus F11]
MYLASRALILGLILGQGAAILVANGSPCQGLCGNVLDSTTPDDIVCKEEDYASSAEGVVFQQCTTCQLRSGYTTGIEHDTQWLLYNLRYAVSYCVFGYPENDFALSGPCLTSTACEPLQHAIMHNNLASNSTAYGYCGAWIYDQLPRCLECLRVDDHHFISNFLTVLQAGCEQRPPNGTPVSVDGTPFSVFPVNITDPTPTATFIPNYYPGPLDLNARVGIAFGSLVLILTVAGAFIIWNGKRKRRAFMRDLETKMKKRAGGWPTPINTSGGSYFDNPANQKPPRTWDDTPQSQKPLRDWDNSPQSVSTEKFSTRYFSPYSSQFNSPDTAVEAKHMQWPSDNKLPRSPVQDMREIGVAFGGPEPSPMWQDVKGKGVVDELYELKEVDPAAGNIQPVAQNPPVPEILPPERPVYGYYNPADHHDSPQEDWQRHQW